MDGYMGGGTRGYKDESDILPSKCLLSKRGAYQSAFDTLSCGNKRSPNLSGTTKDYYHSCAYHLQISWCVHFILGLSLKKQPLSGACHLHVSGKRRKETRKEKEHTMAIKGCVLVSLANASHMAEPDEKGA